MKKLLAITVLLLSCVDPEPGTTTEESEAVVAVPHTGAGQVACWRASTPNAVCTLPQLCQYTPSYPNTASCVSPRPMTSSYSWISVDGPEDCAAGQRACFSGRQYPWGSRYQTRCQVEACGPAAYDTAGTASIFDDGEPIDFGTLCNENMVPTGCPDGLTCVIAGNQAPPPSFPWDLNHGGLLRPIRLCR
jgi:hypothetical protein